MSNLTSTVMPPVDKTPSVDTGNFELRNYLHAFNTIPVFEYQSKATGLTVIHAQVDGPVVNGYFCLATEAFDDDGIPHTLEHLIFLGSELYPYKGVLDLLANRCLASGTNAWTDTDHTCYTVSNAGSDGFLALLPIYLDHILYPSLTDEGFVTEVHHITPEGDDAGVVYCEMQGRENSAESRLHLHMARAIYPGHCGYSSETGGIMKNLRESTTNEKIRAFHKHFYRPENLKLIITGQVKHAELFKVLETVEQRIIAKGQRGTFVRPWQSPVPDLEQSQDLLIKYPADEEDNGIFCIGWRGASAVDDIYTLLGTCVFLKYLTEFPTYTLPMEFVEIKDPYASAVSFNLLENAESCLYLMFEDVPLEKLPLIKPKLDDVLRKLLDTNDINMDRIHNIIKRNKLEHLSNMENNPHSALAYMIIGYTLYGNTKQDFATRLNPIADLNRLLTEPKSFWWDLLRKYFVDNKYVAIQCVPSVQEHEKMSKQEAERVELQRQTLGEEGLKAKAKLLEDAIQVNSKEAPLEVLTSVPIPSLDSINFYEITRCKSDLNLNKELVDLSSSNVYTCFDHIKSEFVYMFALLDSSEVPRELRVYLPLILESLFEIPLKRNEILVPYEEVVEELNTKTISFGASIGVAGKGSLFLCAPYTNTICVMLQVEIEKYNVGLELLRDLLYNPVFSVDRLAIVAQKMNNSAAQSKRSGRGIACYAMSELRFVPESNIHNNGVLVQSRFLTETLEKLSSEKSVEIAGSCEKLWRLLTQPKNCMLHLLGNLERVPNAASALQEFLPKTVQPLQQPLRIVPDLKLLKSQDSNALNGCIIGMGCIESAFFYQSVNTLTSYSHPDYPALELYIQYLTQTEGSMWRQIRGKGYSYGYGIRVKPEEGLLYLIFAKATNVSEAYVETKEILRNQLTHKEWDANLLESARSSLIFEFIEREKSIGTVIGLALRSYHQQIDFAYNRILLHLINKVTVHDLNRVGEKYLRPLLDTKHVKTAIVTSPQKSEQLAEAFKKENIDLTVYPSLEESFLKPV